MSRALTFFSLLYLIAIPAFAEGIDNAKLFPAVAQGHSYDKSTQLEMSNKTSINGTNDGKLNFKSGDLKGDCDGSGCSVTGNNVQPLNSAQVQAIKNRPLNSLPTGDAWATGTYTVNSLTLSQKSININGDVRIFVKENADFGNKVSITKAENSSFYVYVLGNISAGGGKGKSELNGYFYAGDTITLNSHAEINGRVTSKKLDMKGQSEINDRVQSSGSSNPDSAQCFADDFDRGSLGSDSWAVYKSKGNFTPHIDNQRFRLTQAEKNQATAISYNRIFPSKNNKFVIEFDHYAYGGSGADGIALVLSDATKTAKPGAYGGPLGYGYKPDADGFAGGWLGIGIDEYGNFVREGGGNSRGSQNNTVAIRGAGSGKQGYDLLKYTGKLSPEVDSRDGDRPHRYRITVDFTKDDGKARVTVERRAYATSDFDTLIDAFKVEQDYIPEKLLFSITGSTGSSTNIHEIDNVSFCADESEELDAKIDHFRFDVATSNAQACQPQEVTLKACANSSCTQTFNQPVTASLATSNGMEWAGGSSITFTGSTSLQLTSTAKNATLDITGSSPAAVQFSNTLCKVGTGGYSSNSCTLEFSNELKTFELNFPNGKATYAGEPLQVILKPQQNCKPMFANESRTIHLSSVPIQPEPLVNQPDVQLGYEDKDTSLRLGGASKSLDIRFDTNGEAGFTLSYQEAGVTQLNVVDGEIEGSGQFVTVPRALCVSADTSCDDNNSCVPLAAAGDVFDMVVTAHGSGGNRDLCAGPVLQNYVHPVALTSELKAPVGGANGNLAVTEYVHGATTDSNQITRGKNTLAQTIDEVGVFELAASPVGAYQGASLPIASIPATAGRFYPARFVLDSAEVVATHDGDNSKSYMGQPVELSFILNALNADGDITENYQGEFARADVALAAVTSKPEDVLTRVNVNGMPSWEKGKLYFEQNDVVFERDDSPDGPLTVSFGLNVSDGEQPALSPFLNNTVGCDEGCDKLRLGEHEFYYGRLIAISAQGSINDPLSAPLKTEFWNSEKGGNNKWTTFTDDDWTDISMNQVEFIGHQYNHPELTLKLGENNEVKINAGLTRDHEQGVTLESGETSLELDAPKAKVKVNYQINLGEYPWLKFDWNDDGSDDDYASGSFFFGQGGGNNSVIYRREVIR